MNGARRVVILGRVSRGERQQDVANQVAPLRAAARRLGWTIVEVVALKLSAWNEAAAAEVRRRALVSIQAGRADTLMVWAFDRYCREGVAAAFRALRELEHLGAAFYSLQEPFLSTANADASQRELLLSLVAWAARWESQRRSERVKAKVSAKRDHAGVLGQRARWGIGRLASRDEIERVQSLWRRRHTVREIAKKTSLSKSQVGRIVAESRAKKEIP